MIEQMVVTFFPVAFVAILFGGGETFRRRHIDMDGDAPINKTLFYSSKCLIVALSLAMVLHTWSVDGSFLNAPVWLKWAAVGVWIADACCCSWAGSKYLGVYATLLASVLRTLNPVLLG